MAAPGDLTTLPAAKEWLGISDESRDALIGRLITATSSQIQAWLGYKIAAQAYSRRFSGLGSVFLPLPDVPVTSVASVAIDGVAMPPAAGPLGSGYAFEAAGIYLVGGGRFTRGVLNVAATYTAGYSSTPPEIEQACLEWISLAFSGIDRDPSIKSRRAGDTEEVYGGGTTRLGAQTLLMPPSVAGALHPYRRMTPV